ncbi:hypothetical protein BAZSYMB_SCAFFOLD00028_10 [Bathymodiolus azoricus thioautotrophic gill symbiont]|uniref:Uncharacterized protein n=1 Tax=Bathymodiolus azoricus thioautotrophic gill symbiont TaxID=235205 RepID=A0A1H6KUF6_9GAMM|nr:hypothetical protein BAZSYMB_SCAFFOLD00028_10 [Bathymodiolus azoricus thioautotrophic gill symbiont]
MIPVNRNSLPAITILLLPTLDKVMFSSIVRVILTSLPKAKAPLLLTAPFICQASTVGFGA